MQHLQPLAIKALGMVSSLGVGAAFNAAAMRCDRACLKAQLASYYNGKGCKGIEPKKIGREAEKDKDY